MDERLLRDIKHEYDKAPVFTWPFVEVPNQSDVRVYYKHNEEIGSGFIFYAIEHTGHECVPETETDEWHQDFALVECVYQGVAYFDGIRHLYMGDELTDNYGYHHYAHLEANIATLQVIRELEKKYCRDYE